MRTQLNSWRRGALALGLVVLLTAPDVGLAAAQVIPLPLPGGTTPGSGNTTAPLGQGTGPINPMGATEPGLSTEPGEVSSTNPTRSLAPRQPTGTPSPSPEPDPSRGTPTAP